LKKIPRGQVDAVHAGITTKSLRSANDNNIHPGHLQAVLFRQISIVVPLYRLQQETGLALIHVVTPNHYLPETGSMIPAGSDQKCIIVQVA
jgi:hypothetical protein